MLTHIYSNIPGAWSLMSRQIRLLASFRTPSTKNVTSRVIPLYSCLRSLTVFREIPSPIKQSNTIIPLAYSLGTWGILVFRSVLKMLIMCFMLSGVWLKRVGVESPLPYQAVGCVRACLRSDMFYSEQHLAIHKNLRLWIHKTWPNTIPEEFSQ